MFFKSVPSQILKMTDSLELAPFTPVIKIIFGLPESFLDSVYLTFLFQMECTKQKLIPRVNGALSLVTSQQACMHSNTEMRLQKSNAKTVAQA